MGTASGSTSAGSRGAKGNGNAMTTSQATAVLKQPTESANRTAALLAAWERRRKWSRTDSARYLDDRSEPLLALFRREHPSEPPPHTRRFGYWLKEHAPALFDRAHTRLAAAPDDDARARLLPTELL